MYWNEVNDQGSATMEDYTFIEEGKMYNINEITKEYTVAEDNGALTYGIKRKLQSCLTIIESQADFLIGLEDKTGYNYAFYSSNDNHLSLDYVGNIDDSNGKYNEELNAEIENSIVTKFDRKSKGRKIFQDKTGPIEKEFEYSESGVSKFSAEFNIPSLESYTLVDW